jgi:hypothetical protein
MSWINDHESEIAEAEAGYEDELFRALTRIARLETSQVRLIAALKEAKEALEIAKGALEFYANPDNYDFHKSWGKVCIMAKDCETGVRDPFMKIKCGGKRARQALQEIRKVGV